MKWLFFWFNPKFWPDSLIDPYFWDEAFKQKFYEYFKEKP